MEYVNSCIKQDLYIVGKLKLNRRIVNIGGNDCLDNIEVGNYIDNKSD